MLRSCKLSLIIILANLNWLFCTWNRQSLWWPMIWCCSCQLVRVLEMLWRRWTRWDTVKYNMNGPRKVDFWHAEGTLYCSLSAIWLVAIFCLLQAGVHRCFCRFLELTFWACWREWRNQWKMLFRERTFMNENTLACRMGCVFLKVVNEMDRWCT